MRESRETLLALQQSGADVIYTERWKASDDERYDFTSETKDDGMGDYISTLPTCLLVDDDHKTVLSRIDKREHMNKNNIDWLHESHAAWKKDGKKSKFPAALWHTKK